MERSGLAEAALVVAVVVGWFVASSLGWFTNGSWPGFAGWWPVLLKWLVG